MELRKPPVFLKRLGSIKKYLTDEENKNIQELLVKTKWGNTELEQAKRIIEAAKWFNKLGPKED